MQLKNWMIRRSFYLKFKVRRSFDLKVKLLAISLVLLTIGIGYMMVFDISSPMITGIQIEWITITEWRQFPIMTRLFYSLYFFVPIFITSIIVMLDRINRSR